MDGDMGFETISLDPLASSGALGAEQVTEVSPPPTMEAPEDSLVGSLGGEVIGQEDLEIYAEGMASAVDMGHTVSATPHNSSNMTPEEKEYYSSIYFGDYGLPDPMDLMYPELGFGIYKAALQDGCPSAGVDVLNKKLMQFGKPEPSSSKVENIVSGIKASRTAFSTNTLSATPTISTPSISMHSMGDGGMLP